MDIKNFLTVTRFTIFDELHNKSFYALTAVAVLFVLLLRGCFHSNMVVNGQTVNATTIGYNASIVAFNIIASAGVLIAVLLAMRVFKRDVDDGMAIAILSKPVKRIDYVSGKIAGVWVLSYGLTLILHITVYVIMLLNTGGRIPLFIPASFITSVNVLFAVVLVMLFSMIMPDVIAALSTLAVASVSLISDSFSAVSQNPTVQSMMNHQESSTSLWHYVSIIWPKLIALQFFSTSLIKETPFQSSGSVHPLLNVALYCVVIYVALYWKFSKEELQ
jgi:ABC-type transport system involved in multi-copper enzyme maturation permease subunit